MKLIGLALLLIAGAVDDDAFDRTLAALQSGSRATIRGDAHLLHQAAAELRANGAVPLDGAQDLATHWSGGNAQRSLSYRDRVLGPGYRTVMLPGNGLWRSEQAFLAGERARVGIVTSHEGPFSLKIVGDDHELTCHVSSPRRQCDWVPAYTARFSIEVRNAGAKTEQFLIVIQ